jgi:hypothetical protein
MQIPFIFFIQSESLRHDPSVALSFSEDDEPSPLCSLSSQRMTSCIPSSALNKQHIKNDFGIILTGTSFQAFDLHSTIIDADALSILPLGVNCFYSARHHSVYRQDA